MRKFALILFCTLFAFGCQKPAGRWRALEDVSVFCDANEANEIKFTVKKGDICALGQERVVKIFMYKEIACDQGNGWIMYSNGYPFEKLD